MGKVIDHTELIPVRFGTDDRSDPDNTSVLALIDHIKGLTSIRAVASVPPPAPAGTKIVTGLSGHSANASDGTADNVTANAMVTPVTASAFFIENKDFIPIPPFDIL